MIKIRFGGMMMNDFEKLEVNDIKKLDDKAYSRIIDRLISCPPVKKFIDEHNLDYKTIIENFLPLIICEESYQKCLNCKGLNECKMEGVKGFRNIPVIDFYDVISTKFASCEYYNQRALFIYRDFPDECLNYRLKKKDSLNYKRENVIKALGDLYSNKNKKGLFIFGESSSGKTYLAICLANRLVFTGKKKVAYVNVKSFVSEMSKLVIKDPGVFKEKLEIIKNAPYLFLDGLGSEKISKFTRDDVILNILEYRKDHNLKNTIIISKYNINDLKILYNVDNPLQAEGFVNVIKNAYDSIKLEGLDFN